MGDVIIAVDGVPVANVDALRDHFEAAGVGGRVTLTVERGRRTLELEVELVRLG